MGKTQTPRGTKKKEKCKCGSFFYPLQDKKTKECPSCNPGLYKSQKEKEKFKGVKR